jgi:hypothetical protein
MANPAELLYDQLTRWNNRAPNRSNALHRGLAGNFDTAAREHEIAMGHISAIRELVETAALADDAAADEFRAEIPKWTGMVLSFPAGWQGYGNFDTNSLQLLRILRRDLKAYVPTYTPDQIDSVRNALATTLELLRRDGTIKGALAIYLTNLLNHLRQVLDEYDLRGDFDLARATTLLRETVRTAEEVSDNPQVKPLWARLISALITPEHLPIVVDLLVTAAKAIQALPGGVGG